MEIMGITYELDREGRQVVKLDFVEYCAEIVANVTQPSKDTHSIVRQLMREIAKNLGMHYLQKLIAGEGIVVNMREITDDEYPLHQQLLWLRRVHAVRWTDEDALKDWFQEEQDRLLKYAELVARHDKETLRFGAYFLADAIVTIGAIVGFATTLEPLIFLVSPLSAFLGYQFFKSNQKIKEVKEILKNF